MRILAAMMVMAAGAVVATDAMAEAQRLSDIDFVHASRCRGLAGSEALGAVDTTSLDELLRSQKHARPVIILDRASVARKEAERAARRANDERKAELIAERDGVCRTFTG